nr:MAG TPA_asm: hypothetical protein [Caudoviricetes sp.]
MWLNTLWPGGVRVWHLLPATLPVCAHRICRTSHAYCIPAQCTGVKVATASVHPHIAIDRPQCGDSKRHLFDIHIAERRAVLVKLGHKHQAANFNSRCECQTILKPLTDMRLTDLQRCIDVRLNQCVFIVTVNATMQLRLSQGDFIHLSVPCLQRISRRVIPVSGTGGPMMLSVEPANAPVKTLRREAAVISRRNRTHTRTVASAISAPEATSSRPLIPFTSAQTVAPSSHFSITCPEGERDVVNLRTVTRFLSPPVFIRHLPYRLY